MDQSEENTFHIPVMPAEVLQALDPKPYGKYLDGTLGLGGHAAKILEAAEGSQLCGLDRDAAALAIARMRLAPFGERVHPFHLPFAEFANALNALGWEQIDGALLDLGVSSLQLDSASRGFSFRSSGPLDMRMDPDPSIKTAWHLVNRGTFAELRDCIAILGEDPMAGRIARRIIEERQKGPINDTERLADIVFLAYPAAWRRKARRHPATRTFQALRMAVNEELEQLEIFLRHIPRWMAPGGRLVILSFHSLEDRMVKHAMRRWSKEGEEPTFTVLYKKPLCPTETEVTANPRSSCAKLRAAERI